MGSGLLSKEALFLFEHLRGWLATACFRCRGWSSAQRCDACQIQRVNLFTDFCYGTHAYRVVALN